MADVTEFLKSYQDQINQHLKVYIISDGKEGWHADQSAVGGDPNSLNLVLRTYGRKTGLERLTPLLCYRRGDDFIIVASKGGADNHPAWYLNILSSDEVAIQFKDKRHACNWRIAKGEERDRLWPLLVEYYPVYGQYQERTERLIPVVVLTPQREIAKKFNLPPELD